MKRFKCGRRTRMLILLTTILVGALFGFYLSTADALRYQRELGTTDVSEVIQWGVAANPSAAAGGVFFGGLFGAIAAALACRTATSSRS